LSHFAHSACHCLPCDGVTNTSGFKQDSICAGKGTAAILSPQEQTPLQCLSPALAVPTSTREGVSTPDARLGGDQHSGGDIPCDEASYAHVSRETNLKSNTRFATYDLADAKLGLGKRGCHGSRDSSRIWACLSAWDDAPVQRDTSKSRAYSQPTAVGRSPPGGDGSFARKIVEMSPVTPRSTPHARAELLSANMQSTHFNMQAAAQDHSLRISPQSDCRRTLFQEDTGSNVAQQYSTVDQDLGVDEASFPTTSAHPPLGQRRRIPEVAWGPLGNT